MAQKVTVALEDDIDGGPADETLLFGFQGAAFEIDLSGKNARAFRKPARRAGRTAAGRQRSGDVRAWAKGHGIAVSDRGRIPASVLEQYQAAHGR